MRFVGTVGFKLSVQPRLFPLLALVALLSGCPKKEPEATPEPASVTQPPSDKAGAEAPAVAVPAPTPAPAPKKKDEGGW